MQLRSCPQSDDMNRRMLLFPLFKSVALYITGKHVSGGDIAIDSIKDILKL